MRIKGQYEMLAQNARRILLSAALFAIVLSVATTGRAQSNTAPRSGAAATEDQLPTASERQTTLSKTANASTEEKPAAKGPQEGIKVHGHWTIEVKNPDGTVVTHREFENALSGVSGANLLVGLLSGNYVAGPWSIILEGEAGPCSTGPGGQCVIAPPGATSSIAEWTTNFPPGCSASAKQVSSGLQANCYVTLMESLTGSGVVYTSFTLSGTAYADQAGSITNVQTFNEFCPNTPPSAPGTPVTLTTVSPSTCLATGISGNQFTVTTLANPVPVGAGQIVQVTVVISFS